MPAASTGKAATTPRKTAAPKPKPALSEAPAPIAATPTATHERFDTALKELGERAESFASVAIGDLKSRAGPYVDELKSRAGPMVDDLKTRAQPYTDKAGEQFAVAGKVIEEKVKERPFTALLSMLGLGVLLGLILGGGRSR